MREPQGCNRLCPCSAMWTTCYRSVNICMLVSLVAKIWCGVLFILILLATDARMQLDELWRLKSQLVLVDRSRVIDGTPTGFFRLLEFFFWRWVIDSLQFCLTSPAIGVRQAGNRCASEPDHLSCSLPTNPSLAIFHFSEQLKYLQVKITRKHFHPFFPA